MFPSNSQMYEGHNLWNDLNGDVELHKELTFWNMCNPSLGSCKEKKMFVNLCNASLQHFCFLKETKTNGRLSAKKWKRRNVPVIKRQT